jgi:hypothetical protein
VTIGDQPWTGLLVGLLAMVPFTIQAVVFLRNQHRQRSWTHTDAVVLHTSVSAGDNGGSTYHASYNFLDPHGTLRSGKSSIDHRAPNGASLPIVFDPADPTRSQPVRAVGLAHWFAGGLGFFLFAVGVFGIVQSIHLMRTGELF